MSPAKTAEPIKIRWPLNCGLGWPKEPCIRQDPDPWEMAVLDGKQRPIVKDRDALYGDAVENAELDGPKEPCIRCG